MEGAQPSRPVHRRPANSPKGIYKPIDPRPKLPDAGPHHKPDDPRPKEPDAGHQHTPRDQSVGTNHGGLFIQIDQDRNQRIVYPRSSLPRDQDVRLAHERVFYVPGNLNNAPPVCSARPGSSYFSSIIDGAKRPLISVWEQGKFYFNMMKTAKGYYNHYSIGPDLYKYIGSETKGLLYHDYLSKNLRMEENTKYFMNVAAGSLVFYPNSVQKMMLNVNHVNTSISLNGTVNDNWMAKFSFDGILGAQTKAVFYLPTPTFQSKIEFQSLHRFAALTGSFGTGNRPCVDFSCMLGTKLGAVGFNYKLDPATSEFNCSAGLSVKTPCTSVGLIMNQDQIFTATLHKTYPQWRTSIGVKAMFGFGGPFHLVVPRLGLDAPFYFPVAQPVQHQDDQVPRRAEDAALVLGISHSVNKSLLLKSRVTSDGVAAVVVKKTFWGHISLAGSAEVDLCRIRGKPSVGLIVSVF